MRQKHPLFSTQDEQDTLAKKNKVDTAPVAAPAPANTSMPELEPTLYVNNKYDNNKYDPTKPEIPFAEGIPACMC